MTLLRWLLAGQLRAHPGRAATAVLAIAIGVALALGIHLVNRSALASFETALSVVNADAQASVSSAAGWLDESVWPLIADEPAVAAASPLIDTEVRVYARVRAQQAPAIIDGMLRVIGLDAMRAAAVTPGLLPAPATAGTGGLSDVFAADAIFLSVAAMQAFDLAVGDRLTLRAGAQLSEWRIAGTVPGAGHDQRIAVMDIGAAQWRLGWLGRLSRIDLRLSTDVPASSPPAALAARLPADIRWHTPDGARQRMSNLSRAYRVNLNVLALVALFTGIFIVHATVSLGVLRQTAELALLAVLGAPPTRLLHGVLAQGLVLGGLGALLGTALGIGLAAATLHLVGGDLGGGYFRGSTPPTLQLSASPVLLFAALGIAAGVVGSLLPALSIRRIAPAQALRGGGAALTTPARAQAGTALVLFTIAAGLAALPPIGGLPVPAYLSIAALLLAGIACVPLLTGALGGLLARPGTGLWRWPAAWLAVQRVRGAPEAAAAALAGVVASVALSGAMAIMVHSFRVSVDRWLLTVLPADVYGRSNDSGADAALDPVTQRQIASLPGVIRAEFMRELTIDLDPARPPVVVQARELADRPVRERLPLTGETRTPPPGMIPIWVSEAMVDLYRFAPGGIVSLPLTPGGQAMPGFFVAGVWRDYARQHGTIALDLRDWRALTGDQSVSSLALWLAPGMDPDAAMTAVRDAAPALAASELRSSVALRALSLRIFDRSFAVTWVLDIIAVLVGLFGVGAAYSGEALARAREFGMLRHLGVTRSGIARLFGIESAVLISAGVIWGTGIGALVALVLVHRVNPQSFHWTMDLAWPTGLLVGSGLALVVTGVVCALIASRAATGDSPVIAVRSDW